MQKGEVQHFCEPFIYSKHTTTTTLMWCVRLWAVALAYAWLARMPVCTVVDSCASIVADHPVDSLAAPQTMASSSVARMLHATPVHRGHVRGGYGHRAILSEGTMCTDRWVRYYLFSLGVCI